LFPADAGEETRQHDLKPSKRAQLEPPGQPVANGQERDRRDVTTRFRRGNQAARGRQSKGADLERALREAVSPEDLVDVARRVLKGAKAGNVRAAALLFDRMMGRALPAERGCPVIKLDCTTAMGCMESHGRILEQLGRGELSLDQARELAQLIALARESVIVVELERRLAQLEDASGKQEL
jgi:hypothetical protein